MSEIKSHQDLFIIGLTGNIGTGKTLVRKMLQHLGAYGIDADILTHEALKPDSPAQEQIVNRFGASILDTHGAIDRVKLSHIVFRDKKALVELEDILHPLVSTAVKNMISNSHLPIIVIEAIKLLESDLAGMCDSIWVVDAREQVIFDRLSYTREMDSQEIKDRLSHQSPSKNKIKQANVVIENSSKVINAWQQVIKAWDQARKKKRVFSDCIDRTSDLLAFLKDFLITPSSDIFSKVEGKINMSDQPFQYTKWLENKSNFPSANGNHAREEFMRIVCQYFLFTIPDSYNSEDITIWDLSQFELVLFGYKFANPETTNNVFKKVIALIEQFSYIHKTQRIIFLIENHLKERNSFLRENGYKSKPSRNRDTSYCNKAGYNLYQKKLCNTFDLFDNRK